MPSYHYVIESGELYQHDFWMTLPGIDAARLELQRLSADTVRDCDAAFWDHGYVLTVSDDRDLMLFRAILLGLEAPTTRPNAGRG